MVSEWVWQLPEWGYVTILVSSGLLYAIGINLYKRHYAFLSISAIGSFLSFILVNASADKFILEHPNDFASGFVGIIPIITFAILNLKAYDFANCIKHGEPIRFI